METDVINVRGLTFMYPKAPEPAVRGMDFTVGRGEIFGFLGSQWGGEVDDAEAPDRSAARSRRRDRGVGERPVGLGA